MSHEGVLYCKQHHSELFRPKAVVNREDDIKNGTQDAIRETFATRRSYRGCIFFKTFGCFRSSQGTGAENGDDSS